MSHPGILFIITAPSGTGKSTLVHMLLERVPDIIFSVSHTTRPPRPHEVDGKDYFFITPAAFERMVKEREFLECAVVHGHNYGTSEQFVDRHLAEGHDVLLEIDVQGANQVLRKRRGAVGVFLLPPSYEELRRRLVGRATEGAESIRKRLDRARREVLHYSEFSYVVVNRDTQESCAELNGIVVAERCRSGRREDLVHAILTTFVE